MASPRPQLSEQTTVRGYVARSPLPQVPLEHDGSQLPRRLQPDANLRRRPRGQRQTTRRPINIAPRGMLVSPPPYGSVSPATPAKSDYHIASMTATPQSGPMTPLSFGGDSPAPAPPGSVLASSRKRRRSPSLDLDVAVTPTQSRPLPSPATLMKSKAAAIPAKKARQEPPESERENYILLKEVHPLQKRGAVTELDVVRTLIHNTFAEYKSQTTDTHSQVLDSLLAEIDTDLKLHSDLVKDWQFLASSLTRVRYRKRRTREELLRLTQMRANMKADIERQTAERDALVATRKKQADVSEYLTGMFALADRLSELDVNKTEVHGADSVEATLASVVGEVRAVDYVRRAKKTLEAVSEAV